MDNKRIAIAGVVFVGLLVTAIVMLNQRDERLSGVGNEADEIELPSIERESVTALEISRPATEDREAESVRIEKRGDTWWVTSPVEAEADQNTVSTALDKLVELEVDSVAASQESSHELLEVTSDKGIRVKVLGGGDTLADLLVGATRGSNTMVRAEGETRVAAVSGSISYAFNKAVKDWRNRRVVDEEPNEIVAIRFASDNGSYAFERGGDDEWAQTETVTDAEGNEVAFAPIERFGSSKVQSLVSSLARMRASDFAATGVDAATAGLETPAGVVTMEIRGEDESDGDAPADDEAAEGEEAEAAPSEGEEAGGDEGASDGAEATPATESIVLEIGGQVEGESMYYARRRGNETIYVVSQYLAERMRPDLEKFQTPEEGEEDDSAMAPPMPMPGGPGMGEIPPEVLRQLQQQLGMQAG